MLPVTTNTVVGALRQCTSSSSQGAEHILLFAGISKICLAFFLSAKHIRILDRIVGMV